MRILLIHNFYQQFGGEDQVVLHELERLKEKHEVCFYSRHNNDLLQLGPAGKTNAILATIDSHRTRTDIRAIVDEHRPDVAYLHNIYPLISPSIYHALHSLGVPIVQVIHDFRPLCTNGWFYNHEGVCERCKGGNYLHAIRHRCYKDSYAYSALYAAALKYARSSGVVAKVDAFVCLTDFARRKLASAGVPPEKLFVRPNCIDAAQIEPAIGHGNYAAYIGRLSNEKGVWTLIHAMENVRGPMLKIAGTGPEEGPIRDYIEKKGIQNVQLLGFVSGSAREEFLRNCMFTIMPSEWYEMFPMVLLEAWAAGKPVIGSRLGAMADLIEDGSTGLLFEPANPIDLVQKIESLYSSPDRASRMGAQARSVVETRYSPAVSHKLLMEIFHHASHRHMPAGMAILGTA
jgi:glycosyltransferase involved in cell wall biosynthesis